MPLRNWHCWERRNTAYRRRTWRQRRRRNQEIIPLGCRDTARHAHASKRVDIRERCCETVGERLKEGHDLVLFRIGQAEHPDGHVLIVLHLGHWPAVHLFRGARRTVPGSYSGKRKSVSGVIEVHQLLQALDVAVMEELLLEVRPGSLGGRTLRRNHGDVACRGCLHASIIEWRELCPIVIRARPRTGTASQEGSQSQVSKGEAKGICGEAEEIRRVLVINGIPGIQGQAEISRAEAGEQRRGGCCGALIRAVRGSASGWRRRGRSSVDMARVAVCFATEQVVTRHLICGQRIVGWVMQEGVEFRRKSTDIR